MRDAIKQALAEMRKYNLWDGALYETAYIRKDYLNKLFQFSGNKLIKVLIGQRRVGKSYILRQMMMALVLQRGVNRQNIFYLNKEYMAFDEIRQSVDLKELFELYIQELDVKGKIYIFLDEVQNIDQWESFVNSYSQDFTREYEIYVTGSNSKLLSGELASLLSGRFIEFEIFSFSFIEYCEFKNIEINKQNFITYLQTGGLPELIHIENAELERYYIESLKNTIILRDIINRHQIRDPALLEDIFKFICFNIGNLCSLTNVVKYFKNQQKKVNYETLSAYVAYLCDSFAIHEAERFVVKGKQVLGGERKYYLNDPAFKNILFGFSPNDIGGHLENFVYLQLRRKGYTVRVGVLPKAEIDFVATKQETTLYVQVAYILASKETIDREFGNLLIINDNYEKVVVTLDDFKFSDYQGVKHLWPWEL